MKKIDKLSKNYGYYFPMFNNKGMKSFLTPFFTGHIALDHDHYLLEPCSENSLYGPTSSRNVMFYVDDKRYDLNAMLKHQINHEYEYETGNAYQRVRRTYDTFSLDTTSFLVLNENIELHKIDLKNVSEKKIRISALSSVKLFARSAENLRDHRHVTSLLNYTEVLDNGVVLKPSLNFNESGHVINKKNYYVIFENNDQKVEGIIPHLDDFVAGGSIVFPNGTKNFTNKKFLSGYETMGAISYKEFELKPNEKTTFYLMIGVSEKEIKIKDLLSKFASEEKFYNELNKSEKFLQKFISDLSFKMISNDISMRLEDVSLQPTYRRVMGNSYLPHHDYGKGGRGWRDLWQDLIALNMYHNPDVEEMIFEYFKGVRIDGSNATIIGEKIGAFIADRNKIARVWSDHGAWPLITLNMYIQETGNSRILLRKQAYFEDKFTHYSQKNDNVALKSFTEYKGTILEHILIQHIVALNNTGSNGYVKLMDADWNDGLDMGKDQAETIAFTMMYTNNLKIINELLDSIEISKLDIYEPLVKLLNYEISLEDYFDLAIKEKKKTKISKLELMKKISNLYNQRLNFLRQNAFQNGFYQSYIDKEGLYLDNEKTMMLTGQAMALLNDIATKDQATSLIRKTKELLYESNLGGYKLNTKYEENKFFGRAFYFSYNHKENGAVFSHMVMMYAFGLYNYGYVKEGRQAMMNLLELSLDKKSKVYRGIPEYFNDKGEGKYSYLTGSASWLIYLIRNQIFGIKFKNGNLFLEPKLDSKDFIDSKAIINTVIFGKKVEITYQNENLIPYNEYKIESIFSEGKKLSLPIKKGYNKILVRLIKK